MTTRTSPVDVIVVGAGQAGVSLSYFLQKEGVSHLVLERDRALSAWHRRWDGFHANTPAWMNTLPVLPEVPGGDPDGFISRTTDRLLHQVPRSNRPAGRARHRGHPSASDR